ETTAIVGHLEDAARMIRLHGSVVQLERETLADEVGSEAEVFVCLRGHREIDRPVVDRGRDHRGEEYARGYHPGALLQYRLDVARAIKHRLLQRVGPGAGDLLDLTELERHDRLCRHERARLARCNPDTARVAPGRRCPVRVELCTVL